MEQGKVTLDTIIHQKEKTYVELANGLGVSRETFWRYRKEPSRMRMPQWERLAELLDMDVTELLKIVEDE